MGSSHAPVSHPAVIGLVNARMANNLAVVTGRSFSLSPLALGRWT